MPSSTNYPTTHDSSSRLVVSLMLDDVSFRTKPNRSEVSGISKRLVSAAQELPLEEIAQRVCIDGCSFIPALLNGQGRKKEHWVQQQMFCLDFDGGMSLEQFHERCNRLRITPAIVYTTFSHTPSHPRFRVIFVLNQLVTDTRLRNLIVNLMLKLFPAADKACKDPSRLYFGGKDLVFNTIENRIAVVQLMEGYLKELEEEDPKNFSRNRKRFFEKMGMNTGLEYLGVFECNDFPKMEDFLFSLIYSKRENHISSKMTPSPHTTDLFRIQWKGKDGAAPQERSHAVPSQIDFSAPGSKSKPHLSNDQIDSLRTRCQLLNEFVSGTRRLANPERRILLSNLRWIRNGMTLYRSGLIHFDANSDHPDPYERDDAYLIHCADEYDFKPESCSNCPYDTACNHSTNLLQMLPLRRNACRVLDTARQTLPLDEVRSRVTGELRTILEDGAPTDSLTIMQADCGVGKTETLLKLLPRLQNICVAFPTHRLAREAHDRLCRDFNCHDYFLWPERPPLPRELQDELKTCDAIGLSSTREVYERALSHEEVRTNASWSSQIERFLVAFKSVFRQSRLFCTHEKALQLLETGTTLIQTVVFDEDPLRTLFRTDHIRGEDLAETVKRLTTSGEANGELISFFQELQNTSPNHIGIPPKFSRKSRRELENTLVDSDIASPVLALLDCTGYIKPQMTGRLPSNDVHCISHRRLPPQYSYVMLSATPVIPLYQRLYQERLRLVETGQVVHRGKLYLHRERSYSRSSIASLKSGFPSIVEDLAREFDLDGVITFKEWTKDVHSQLLLKGAQQPIHVFSTFGATEGTNVATGKRIGVIGTPHLPEFTLKLLGHAVGIPSTEIEFEYKPRVVRRAEFEASLWCLADTGFFQDLELTLVERELVQAVGRARLLENDAEVHLWSNYVLSGGEVWQDMKKAQ